MGALSPYLECGKIINTHGIKGAVKIDPWTDTPKDFLDFKRVFLKSADAYREVRVLHSSVFKQFIICELEGVCDMDAAETMKNKLLYAAREDFNLAEGQYFLADIEGVDVIDDRDGKRLGVLEEILPGAASAIYAVRTDNGQVLVPAVPEFVKDVCPGEFVRIRPIDGMFDEL
ncbi:MAG: 16S rRNA processing protein RimM [Clostridia bacterium]|nr:16S rRNA processing protein RimM [Clostridia bacterium]